MQLLLPQEVIDGEIVEQEINNLGEVTRYIINVNDVSSQDNNTLLQEEFMKTQLGQYQLELSNTSTISSSSVPMSTVKSQSGVYSFDSRASTFNTLESGGVSGVHHYNISSIKNTVDVLADSTPIQIVAGSNVTVNNDVVVKSLEGNSWNAAFYSTQAFDPVMQDFAISWKIESVDGTIREMGGLDDNPSQNSSYTSIEYAMYQVNGYLYSRVYESGAAIEIPNYSNINLTIGDRLGMRVVSQEVTYFIQKGSEIIDVYTSTKKATAPMYFKAALNRGAGSSGAASVEDVRWHTEQMPSAISTFIKGQSTDIISDTDKDILSEKTGIDIQEGSTYALIYFKRSSSDRFSDGTNPYSIDVTHSYYGVDGQDIKTIDFN